ncbi:hypothetical protein [Thermococcus sp. 21S7]|uniref:hypothetical protein n=1 Tax=Thermococcus sp. 21S7 TaxID=1638221 RepID=UPI001438B98B|nr:hypothetical protein [Thermococcus sp. 21S7]NJE60287.1 hypothetical protein [Thermococcus sp. 21S7]
MRTYSFGSETVPVAMAGELLVGIVHDGRSYKIMLARLDGEEIAETRFLSGQNDWEGHSALKLDDGYLIGGSVEGTATPDGGEGWKAYLARLDENLGLLWELKLDVRSNGAVHSILPGRDGMFIADETGRPGDKGFFIGKVSPEGEPLWLRDFGSWDDVLFTALLPSENRLRLIGSVKTGDGRWEVKSFDFSENGEPVDEEALAEGIALTACLWNGELVLAGYRGENFWVQIGEREIQLGEGSATSLLPIGDKLLVGGELEGNAVIVEIADGKDPKVRELWGNGWVEVLGKNVVAGVTRDWEMVLLSTAEAMRRTARP